MNNNYLSLFNNNNINYENNIENNQIISQELDFHDENDENGDFV